jgi:hypothetical protein
MSCTSYLAASRPDLIFRAKLLISPLELADLIAQE